ncbi:acyltransferase family protein [Jongsikchunia kroppenstedtii]|uniref:acyltransferase family protein n=1 Tax=Jongsikchunia kroppenstedtii TaxID=1121721 RepID=UPI0003768A50
MMDVPSPRDIVRNDALTGLRAVAALAVCGTHAAFWTGRYTDDFAGRFFGRLEVGVAIFFVLSGFLLFRPWVRSLRTGAGSPSTARYFRHRALRILPAYWLTVLVVYLIYRWREDPSPSGHGATALLRNLTLTQTYGIGNLHTGLTQMWSLVVEVGFYLVLPPLAWVICVVACRGQWRPEWIIVWVVAFAAVTPLWVAYSHSPSADPTSRLWPPEFAIWFAAGMLLAVLAELDVRWPGAIAVVVALAAFVIACTSIAGEPTIAPASAFATDAKALLYAIVGAGLVGGAALAPTSLPARLLSLRPVVWLGEISYELFLVHVMVLELVMSLLGYRLFSGSTTAAFLVTVVISIPIAWILHQITYRWWRRVSSSSGKNEGIAAIPRRRDVLSAGRPAAGQEPGEVRVSNIQRTTD